MTDRADRISAQTPGGDSERRPEQDRCGDTDAQGIRYNPTTGNLFSDADGSGPIHAIMFAHLDPGLNLTASDFLIA